MFGGTFGVTAVFKNANGLQKGNNVRFSGINVGTVHKIEMINDTTIWVYMNITDNMQKHIKKDAVAMIGSDGLVGSMLINIVPGVGNSRLIEAGDELRSLSKIATQDMISTLNVTNENAAMLTADLLKVTQSLTKGKGTFGKLLNDTIMATDLHQTISNLKNVTNSANTTIVKLNGMLSKINLEGSVAGIMLSDTISALKMKQTINNLEKSSSQFEQMFKELNNVIDGFNNKDGFVQYVSRDTALVLQLERTMLQIEEGTARFNENMEALKHNFLTRRYFRKQEKQDKKNTN